MKSKLVKAILLVLAASVLGLASFSHAMRSQDPLGDACKRHPIECP
jgi:hypothetical protein